MGARVAAPVVLVYALAGLLAGMPSRAQVDPTLLLPEDPAPVTTLLDRHLEALVDRAETGELAVPALEALADEARTLYRTALAPANDPAAGAGPLPYPAEVFRGQVQARAGRLEEGFATLAALPAEPAALWLTAFHRVIRWIERHDFAADDSGREVAAAALDRGLKAVTSHSSDAVTPWLNAFAALRLFVLEEGTFQGDRLPSPALRWEWDAVLLAAAARAGRHDIVVPLGRRLTVVFPEDAFVRSCLARSLLANGRSAESRSVWSAAASRGSLGWRARVWWGNSALAAGDAPGALAVFDELVKDVPDRAETWAARAAVHRALRGWDAVSTDLETAVGLAPAHADLLLQLGIARYHLDRFEPAVEALRRAVELQPAEGEGHQYLGLALRNLGRRSEALSHLDRAVRLRPNSPDARAYRGITRHEAGDFAGAVEDYDHAFRLGLEGPIFLAKRGEAQASLRRFDLARKDLREFLARYPDHGLAGPVRSMLEGLPEE